MKVLASFLWEAEAMAYIDKHKLNEGRRSAMIERDIHSGKWNVLDLS